MWENALTLLNLFVVILVLVLQILVLCTPRRTGICGHLRVAMEEKVSLTLTPDEDLSACLFAFFKAKCDSKQFQDISAKEDIKQQLPAIDFPDKSDNKCNVCAKERVCSCSFPLSACEQNSTEDTSNNDNCLVDETDTTAIDIGSVESETDQGEDENIDSQCSSFDTNEAKLQRNIKRHDEVEICHGPSEFDFAEAKHEQSNNHDQVDGKSQRNNKVNIPGERSVSLHLDVHANIDRYDTVLLNEKVDNNSQNNNEMTIPISWNDIPDADFEVNNVSSVSLHEASKLPAIRESCGNELGHRNNVAFGQNSPLDSSAQDCSVEENVMYKNCHNGKEDYCRPAVAINTTCNYAYDTCEFTASVNSCIERNQNSYNGTDDNAFVSTDCTIENTDVCFNNVNNNGDQYKAERYSNSMTKQDEHDFKCQGVQEPFSEKESIEPYEHIISNDTTCGSDINDMNRDLYVSESLCAQGLDNTCSSKCNVFDTRNSALDTDLIESIRKKCSSVEQDKNVVCNDLSHHGPDADQPVPVSEYIPEQDHIDPQIESITEIETETKLQQCLDEELQCGSEFDPYDFVDEVDYLTSDVFYVKVHKPSLKKLQVKILGDAEENATKESKTAGKENDNQDCITVMDGKTSNTKTSNENAVKKMVMGVNRCVVEAPQEASGHFFPDCGSKDVKEQKETPSTSVFHNRTRQRTIACTGPSSQQQQNNSYTFAISCKTNMDFMLMDTPTLIIQMSFPKTSIARKNNVYAICRPKKQSNPISGQAHIWADSRFALAVDKVWVSCKAAFQKHPITVPWASCSGTIELKLSFQQPLNDRGIEHYLKRQLQNVNEGHMSLHEAKKSEEADTVIVFPSQETCDQSSLPIQIKPSIRGQRESPISLQKEQPLRDILKTDVELYTPEKDSEGSFLLHNFHHEKGITETDAFPDIRLNPGVQLFANDVDTMIKLEVSSAKHKQKGSIQIREDNHMCVHLRQEVDDGYNSFESETDGVTYTDCDIEVDTVPDIQVQLKETNSLQKLTPECFQCHRGPYSDGQFPVKCYTNQALKSDSSTCQTVDEVGYLASDVCYMEVHKPSLKNMQVKILGDAEQNATKESKTVDKENDSEDCTTIMEGNLCNTTASKKTAVNKVFIDVNRCDVEAPQEASRQWFPDSGSKDVKEPSETLLTSDITETDAIPDKPLNPGAQLLANDVDTIIKHQVHETQLKSEVSSVKHSPGRKIKIGEDNSMFVNLRQDVVGGYSCLESETGGVIHTDCEIEVDTAPDVRDNANILQILRPEDLQCNRGNHSSDPYPNSCYNDQASESDSTTYERVLLTVTRCSNNFQSQQKINLVVVSDCVSLKDSTIQDGEQNTITLDRSSSDSAYNSMDSFSSDGNEQFQSSYNSLHGATYVSNDDFYSSMDSMPSKRNKFESFDINRYQASDVSNNDSDSCMDSTSSKRNKEFESFNRSRYEGSDVSNNEFYHSMDPMSFQGNKQFERSNTSRYEKSDVTNNDSYRSRDSTSSERNKQFQSSNRRRYQRSDISNNDSYKSMDSMSSESNKQFESPNRSRYEASDVSNNDSDSSIYGSSDISNNNSFNIVHGEIDTECHIEDSCCPNGKDDDAAVGIKCKMKPTETNDKEWYQNISDWELSVIEKSETFIKYSVQEKKMAVQATPEYIRMQCYQNQSKRTDISTNSTRNDNMHTFRVEDQPHLTDSTVSHAFGQVGENTDFRICTVPVPPTLEQQRFHLQSSRVGHQCNVEVGTVFDPLEREKEYRTCILSPTLEPAVGKKDDRICIKDGSQIVLSIGEQDMHIYDIEECMRERKKTGLQILKGNRILLAGCSIKLSIKGRYDIIAVQVGNRNIVQVNT